MAIVLITGASKGIGLATALAFARARHRVAAGMRNPAQAPWTSSSISATSRVINPSDPGTANEPAGGKPASTSRAFTR